MRPISSDPVRASAARPLAADQLDEELFERALCRCAPARTSSMRPCATSRPSAMTPMWVESRSTISRMCDVRKMVPPRATNACSRSLIWRDATASIPSNGSSRKSSRGAGSSAAASDSFFRMPCEKSVTSVVGRAVEVHQRQQVRGARVVKVSRRHAVDLRDEAQRFRGGQPVEQREILGHDADAPLDLDRIGERIDAEDAHLAAEGRSRPGEALDRRGLAGAVGPEEAVEAAGRNREVDAVHRALRSERPRQPACLDREFHRHSRLYVSMIGMNRLAASAARTCCSTRAIRSTGIRGATRRSRRRGARTSRSSSRSATRPATGAT